ncbi:MAG: DUF488 domain-containing protein [Planctomycetota bacterium]
MIYTLGYGRWPTKIRLERLIQTLLETEITTLVDIRHSPCPSQVNPLARYGPRDWHLLDGGIGLNGHLRQVGIDYQWIVELGNPQKNDREMRILRAHLAVPVEPWPVNRGLELLQHLVRKKGQRCCLLCACKDYDRCHRKLIAEAVSQRFFDGMLEVRELPSSASQRP